jgi:hypothetical protein
MNTESKQRGTVLAAFILGVVAAAAGTATAATLITGRDVRNNSLTGVDIRSGSLTGSDIRNSSLTGVDIRNGSIGSADLAAATKSSLKGDPGARGRQGTAGARGAQGPRGATGAAGNNATGLTMGTTSITAGTSFAPLGGNSAGSQTAEVPGITPNVALTMSAMAARAYNLVAGEQITVTVQVDNVDTALSCTVTAATSLCVMPGALSLPPRSTVGVKLLSSALGANRVVSWSWTFS